MSKISISGKLKEILYSAGASLVGYADLSALPLDVRNNLPYGISIGMPLAPDIVAELSNGPTLEYFEEYKRINLSLRKMGEFCESYLKENGYEVGLIYPVLDKYDPVMMNLVSYEPKTLSTQLPHKTVATRAGLGWIGKNALLVTKSFGSAVRLTTVLTDADLAVDKPVDTSNCGSCTACVDVCPGHAPSGKNWAVGIHRDSFFNAASCRESARDTAQRKIGINETVCGMCIAVCPWTQKYIKRNDR